MALVVAHMGLRQFDDAVAWAHETIESPPRYLAEAERQLQRLATIARLLQWVASRGFVSSVCSLQLATWPLTAPLCLASMPLIGVGSLRFLGLRPAGHGQLPEVLGRVGAVVPAG